MRTVDIRTILAGALTVSVGLAFLAGCAVADPLKADPDVAIRAQAAYGAAMLNIYEAQRAEYHSPKTAVESWQAAAALLEKAHAADPSAPKVAQLLTACHIRLGKFDKAAAVCEDLIDSGKIDPSVLVHVISTLVRLRDYPRAIALTERFLSKQEDLGGLAPSKLLEQLVRLYALSKRVPQGTAYVRKLFERRPDNEQVCRALIALLLQEKQSGDAEKVAAEFVKRKPDAIRIRVQLAEMHRRAGRQEALVREIEEILKQPKLPLDARLVVAHTTLQYSFQARKTDDRRRALALLEQVLAQASKGFSEKLAAELTLRVARLHTDLKNFDKAEPLLRDLLKKPAASWRNHAALADLLWERGRRKEAIQSLRDYLAKTPRGDDTRRLRMALADYHEKSGDRASAVKALRQNLAEKPDDPDTCNHLGYLYALWGENLEESVKLVRTALKAEPENAAYLDSMAWALYKTALRDDKVPTLREAGALLEKAVKAMNDDPVISDHMGDVYFVEGRLQDAVKQWKAALDRAEPGTDALPGREHVEKKVTDTGKLIRDLGTPTRPMVRPLKPPSAAAR